MNKLLNEFLGGLIIATITSGAANAQYMQAPAQPTVNEVQDTVKNLAAPTMQTPIMQPQVIQTPAIQTPTIQAQPQQFLPNDFGTEAAPASSITGSPASGGATGGEIIDLRPAAAASFPYLSGGIGADEVANMQTQKANYNFHVMSADKTGHFTGEIALSIKDASGATLFASEAGPLFYATLPNGRYNVTGERDGVVKSQKIIVAQGKPAHIHFGW